MPENTSEARDLVMTQADLPPAIEVPPSSNAHAGVARRVHAGEPHPPTGLLRDIRKLAERVGGFDKLRELIDELAKLKD